MQNVSHERRTICRQFIEVTAPQCRNYFSAPDNKSDKIALIQIAFGVSVRYGSVALMDSPSLCRYAAFHA